MCVFNGIWHGGPYLPTGSMACMKLLAKKGKDPTLPSSYSPISLINVDTKILSKIVASLLDSIIPILLHPAQAGFVTGRSAVLHICKVILALEHTRLHPDNDTAILSPDAEKAFDNINFQWLFLVF